MHDVMGRDRQKQLEIAVARQELLAIKSCSGHLWEQSRRCPLGRFVASGLPSLPPRWLLAPLALSNFWLPFMGLVLMSGLRHLDLVLGLTHCRVALVASI